MNRAKEYHRDIYSGMVASELGKEGYFGEEYRLYGYLNWQGGRAVFSCMGNEAECAQEYWHHLRAGNLLSPYCSVGERIYTENSGEIGEIVTLLQQQLQEKLTNTYGAQLAQQSAMLQNAETMKQMETALLEYKQQLTGKATMEQELLLWQMAKSFLKEPARQVTILEGIPEEMIVASWMIEDTDTDPFTKILYGFVWKDEREQDHGYCNVYLPAALQKWFKIKEQGNMASLLLTQKFSTIEKDITIAKTEFQKKLMRIFNAQYWDTWRKLCAKLQ